MRYKRAEIAETILNKKENSIGITIQILFYRAIVIKTGRKYTGRKTFRPVEQN